MNTAGTLMEGGMEATWLIFVVVLLGLVFSFSKERKFQREKNYMVHGDNLEWERQGGREGEGKKGRVNGTFPPFSCSNCDILF